MLRCYTVYAYALTMLLLESWWEYLRTSAPRRVAMVTGGLPIPERGPARKRTTPAPRVSGLLRLIKSDAWGRAGLRRGRYPRVRLPGAPTGAFALASVTGQRSSRPWLCGPRGG